MFSVTPWFRVFVNGHFISYRTAGSPTDYPAIFMHGGTQDGHQWKPHILQRFVQEGFYCIVMNRLGFGQYSDEQDDWPDDYLEQGASDMLKLLYILGIKQCVAISWCDGANVTLIAASQNPSLFTGIVASVPHLTLKNTSEELDRYFESWNLATRLFENKRYREVLIQQYGSYEKAKRIFNRWLVRCSNQEWIMKKDLTWCLPHIDCPVFVVVAGKDMFFLPVTGLSIVPKLKHATSWIAEDAPHMIHTSPAQQEFVDRSCSFLKSLNLVPQHKSNL